MKTYELIKETYDLCNGKPKTEILEVTTDNPDTYIREHLSKASTFERTEQPDGTILYEVLTNGLKVRYTFSSES